MPGILGSRIGHLNGSEIVQVEYDPLQTNPAAMVQALRKQSSFYSLIVKNEAEGNAAGKWLSSSDIDVIASKPRYVESKHSLRTSHPELYYLDLTEQQAILLNSWSYFGGPMPDILTPEQRRLLPKLKATLSWKSAASLSPARQGKELDFYRKQLLQWLGNIG